MSETIWAQPALAKRQWRTARLLLRPWRAQDLPAYAALNADPAVMAHFPDVLSKADSDALAQRCQSLIDTNGAGFWAVQRLDTGEFIGHVGLHTPAADLPFSPCVEIGWRLASEHWQRGFATEAAREALRIGFDELQLPEIVAFTTISNLASQAVMKRLGMQRTLAEDFLHPALPAGHRLQRHGLWRLSARDWREQRAQDGDEGDDSEA